MMKAQTEVLMLLGVFVVIIIVVYYALAGGGNILPSPLPKGVYEEQKEVAGSVESILRSSADNAIKDAIIDGEIPNDYDAAYRFMLEKAKELGLEP